MSTSRRLKASSAVLGLACMLVCGACAHQPVRREPRGVNIERRRTPPQPDTATARSTPERPRTTVMTSETLRGALADIAADTTAARKALNRCAGKKLLPDQEGIHDGTTRLLIQVHDALAVIDFARAQSLARQARQLSVSLACR